MNPLRWLFSRFGAAEIKRIEALQIEDGDTVVIQVDFAVSDKRYHALVDWLTPYFPRNKILILDRGMTLLGAIRAANTLNEK